MKLYKTLSRPSVLITADEVGVVLAIKGRTVRHWAQIGDLPAPVIDKPRCKRWSRADIDRWIKERSHS